MPELCNNLYNDYYKEEFDYYYPYRFNQHDLDYLIPDRLNHVHKEQISLGEVGRTLKIEISGNDIPTWVKEYISPSTSLEARVVIYNFRYESIYQIHPEVEEDQEGNILINIPIGEDIVSDCFSVRGLYFCEADLEINKEEESPLSAVDEVEDIQDEKAICFFPMIRPYEYIIEIV